MKFKLFITVFIIVIFSTVTYADDKTNLIVGIHPQKAYAVWGGEYSNIVDNNDNTCVKMNPYGYLIYDLGAACDIDSFETKYSLNNSPITLEFYDSSDLLIHSTTHNVNYYEEYQLGLKDVRKIKIINSHSYYTTELRELYLYGRVNESEVSLNINSESNVAFANDVFNVYVDINGAKDIYAEDFTVSYDTSFVEFVNAKVVDTNNTALYYSEARTGSAIRTEGAIRLITSGKDSPYAINGQKKLIKLKFRAKNTHGETFLRLSSGLVANGSGIEIKPTLNDMIFTVCSIQGDVNQDGIITLADLALTNKLLGTPKTSWGSYYPDSNNDGVVSKLDLIYVTNLLKD